MREYLLKEGKKLRCGYTTGSCAAAAAKAAVYMLFNNTVISKVKIDTPAGKVLDLEICDGNIGRDWTQCGVIKDGGDDPDITSGLVVYAKAEMISGEDVIVDIGEGIGRVTRPGLQVKPGEPAINPVPLSMIHKEVKEVLPEGKGVKVTLSIPGGEKIAQKTFNPKLGIVGGLSIIGTSGIVMPMSTEALKKTLELELSILAAEGNKKVILVPGNYGKKYAIKEGKDESLIIAFGNFLGFILDKAVEYRFKELELIGDIGKLIKVAAGIFNTAGRVADARAEIMTAYAAYFGVSQGLISKILYSITTEEALKLIEESRIGMQEFYDFIVRRVKEKLQWYSQGKLDIDVTLYSRERGFLAKTSNKTQALRSDAPW